MSLHEHTNLGCIKHANNKKKIKNNTNINITVITFCVYYQNELYFVVNIIHLTYPLVIRCFSQLINKLPGQIQNKYLYFTTIFFIKYNISNYLNDKTLSTKRQYQ